MSNSINTNIFGDSGKFDDPFLLPSSEYIPENLESALDFCLFLYYLNPQYRRASARVVRHFITDFDTPGDGSASEKEALKEYLTYDLRVPQAMAEMGDEWSCFSGETRVVTRNGVFQLKDMVGKTVEVLSRDGVYRTAKFDSYGVQKLRKVTFSDGREVFATPEHRWEVKNCSGDIREVITDQLCSGHKIKRTVAPRPDKNDDYYKGVRHGFVYGDGTLENKGTSTRAYFYGQKDSQMLSYFDGHGNAPRVRADRPECTFICGLPAHLKTLPDNTASSSYWYGFVSGFLAADGTVDTHGCAVLTQCDDETLRAIEAQLPRIGMCAGPLRYQDRITDLTSYSGAHAIYDSRIYFMTLLKRFMQSDDFLMEHHREKFEKNFNPDSKYGEYIRIASVEETDREEEVYCCLEEETHTMVIENGIFTFQCYGNGFWRIHYPFDRFLVDRRYDCEYSLDWFGSSAKFNLREFVYEVPDPKNTQKIIKLPFRDRMALDKSRIKLRKINPRQMVIDHNFISGTSRYIYKFEQELVKDIKDGNLTVVNEIPVDMLKAVRNDQDFLFYPDEIFHFKAPTISGVSNEGWGLPETLANYRSLHLLQVYRKIDESIGLDYMVPFRLFSPESTTSESSIVKDILLHRWKSEIQTIVKNRRKDKFAIHALPFPVNYQEFGADGKNLTPKDLIEYQTDSMLDAMGYPAELFKGSLKVEQIPTAVRLFENSFMFVHLNFTQFIQWVNHRISVYMGEPEIEIQLQRPSMADNLDRQNILLQLSSGGEISRAKAYSFLGVDDPVEEIRTRAEEDAEIQKVQMKKQQELEREMLSGSLDAQLDQQEAAAAEQQAGMGANAAGGMPGQGGGGAAAGITPMDAEGQSQEKAQMWLSMPEGERRRDMMATKETNPQVYSRAKQIMEEMRSQARSDGVQMLNEQAQGGQ